MNETPYRQFVKRNGGEPAFREPERKRETMAKPYYTLIQYDPTVYDNGKVVHRGMWFAQFGDYDRECVEFERDEIRNSEMIPLKYFKIITTNGKQAAIDAAIAKLNS